MHAALDFLSKQDGSILSQVTKETLISLFVSFALRMKRRFLISYRTGGTSGFIITNDLVVEAYHISQMIVQKKSHIYNVLEDQANVNMVQKQF